MKVLGIDPGSNITGYGIIEKSRSGLKWTAHGEIRAPRNGSLSARLLKLHSEIARLIASTNPDAIAIEEIFCGKNVQSLIKQGHARGVAILASAQSGVPIFEYSPNEIKTGCRGVRSCGERPDPEHGQSDTGDLGDPVPGRIRRTGHSYLPFKFSQERVVLMFALITGKLAAKSANEVIVDVGGLGYQVFIPLSTFYELPEKGDSVTFHIHTHVKEDAIQLFGFQTPEEKAIFQLMIQVSGIGPKLAINVLSGISAPELVRAVSGGDLARLVAVPGIGKKTAERVILELRDKFTKLAQGTRPRARAGRCHG